MTKPVANPLAAPAIEHGDHSARDGDAFEDNAESDEADVRIVGDGDSTICSEAAGIEVETLRCNVWRIIKTEVYFL